MTYRLFVTLLLCFMVSACAGSSLPTAPNEEPLVLPERFLGTWVYSYYDIISIEPGGLIKDFHTEDKDVPVFSKDVYASIDLSGSPIEQTGRSSYRVIYVESPYSVYLLYRNNSPDPAFRNYEYVHFIVRPEDYIYKDRPEYLDKPPAFGWTYGCNTTEEDWTTPRITLQERLLCSDQDDCTIAKLREYGWLHETYNRALGFQIKDSP